MNQDGEYGAFFDNDEGPSREPIFKMGHVHNMARLPMEGSFGTPVIHERMLAESGEGACLLRSLIAYQDGFHFFVEAQLRRSLQDGPGTQGNNAVSFAGRLHPTRPLGSGLVQIGLRTQDRVKYSVRREPGAQHALLLVGSRGRSSSGVAEFWFSGLPVGALELWVAWPAAKIQETCQILDGDAIREAGEGALLLWTDL